MSILIVCDGGCKGNPGPMTAGWVIYNRTKNMRRENPNHTGRKELGEGTNNLAEYHAIIEGLKDAHSKYGKENYKIFTDSNLVVSQINGDFNIKQPKLQQMLNLFKTVVGECTGSSVEVYWTPRQLTLIADKVAGGKKPLEDLGNNRRKHQIKSSPPTPILDEMEKHTENDFLFRPSIFSYDGELAQKRQKKLDLIEIMKSAPEMPINYPTFLSATRKINERDEKDTILCTVLWKKEWALRMYQKMQEV